MNNGLNVVPKISVIMGIYNCEKTLSEAIDSLFAQTYTDWQLIMCDDGSTDGTYALAKKYKEKFPDKIVLIKNEKNCGLNATLNNCLKYAIGEYVARMDGDDVSLPERFEKEVGFLEKNRDYAIVSCPLIYFDDDGVFRTDKGGYEPQTKSFVKRTPFSHAPCMVKREAYSAVNGYSTSDKTLRVEDWDLWIRMYAAGFKGYMLSEPLYKMRDDRNALSRRKFKYRLNEARVISSAVKKLKLPVFYYVWAMRPIILGLLPKFLYNYLHRKKTLKSNDT